jgi:hypothetical protein
VSTQTASHYLPSAGYYFGKAPDDKIYNLKKCIRCPETTFSLAGSEGMSSCFCKGGYYGKDQNCTACDRGLWAPTGISTNRTDCLPIDSYWRIASYGQTCEAACKIDNKTSDEESMRLWENTAESPVRFFLPSLSHAYILASIRFESIS